MGDRIELGPDDSGKEIIVNMGDRIIIRLPENPTTGWRWQTSGALGPVELTGDNYDHSAGGGIGAATTRTLEFKAKSAGQLALQLVRVPEWQDAQKPDARFLVTLLITATAQP